MWHIKQYIYIDYISVTQEKCDYIFWTEVRKTLSNFDQDLYLGTVYIPPDRSKYMTDDTFHVTDKSIMRYAIPETCLTGIIKSRIDL